MKNKILIILLIVSMNSFAQEMRIINTEEEEIIVTLSSKEKTKELIEIFNGRKDESLRKKWTSRTYRLSNNQLLIEFYDGQSILIDNQKDFKKLERVRFVKNNLSNFKKNISYKIEIPFEEGKKLSNSHKATKITKYKSSSPQYHNYDVYRLTSSQILFLEVYSNFRLATIYKDIKTLSAEHSDIEEIEYEFDDEHYMKELANGNPLDDFEPNQHVIYPKYVEKIIKNHNLTLKETKIFVGSFWSNLYQSQRGYWILIDEINQSNGAGKKLSILTLRIYNTLEEVREAQAEYEKFKTLALAGMKGEHLYQKISDQYGKNFPNFIDSLISELPQLLNFDKEQLSIDENGLSIIDEAIKWNHNDGELFDNWFPSALAFCGALYIETHKTGKWDSKLDKKYNVWIPQVTLDDNTAAFDTRYFCKDLFESPIPLKWAARGFNKKGKK